MNWESLLTVAVALCCVFAISTAATSLESSVTTDPDEVIDLDETGIPIGTDSAVSLKSQVQSEGTPNATSTGGGTRDGDQGTDGSEGTDGESVSAGEGEQTTVVAGGQSEPDSRERDGDGDPGDGEESDSGGSAAGTPTQATGPGAGQEQGLGPGESTTSLLERLLAALLALLRRLAPALLALGLLALAFRYRDRLGALLRDRLERWGVIDPGTEESSDPPPAPAPRNQVSEAWYEFVEALGLGDVRSRAPRECAAVARAQGVDEETVDAITEPFEAVRYGQEPVTEARRERARDGLRRFRANHGSAPTGEER
ncbi:DUF4129 domain-containing protein [Haloarchaeobius amylolyticus]|uniref:DUF4129 domain-containing protein n=1 Tax=Haloarchaeobius amylolyticus TaxID=1198296 RepID=UPI002270433F|nr:DUF4129 domain-containing protein [Haloarchaeobius amylolyticus]